MKYVVCIVLWLACSLSANAQRHADRQELANPESFSMILLGDPQGYVKYDFTQPILELCTAWIADNVEQLQIKAVLCTGDLVENNENIIQDSKIVNQTSREMWEAVSRSFARLDHKVPYIISTGNHDYGYLKAECGITHFPEYFPFERNSKWRPMCVSAYPNRNAAASLENAAFELNESHWGRLLVVAVEFAPRDEVLEWAKMLAAKERYKDAKVILLLHSFLYERSAKRIANENYKIQPRNWGQAVWEKLVKVSPNIRLVVCGHSGVPGSFEDSVAYRVDKNDSGKEVHQMMFNVQTLGGGWEGNGGDGWLRILEFMPDGRSIGVRTYSPLFGISPATKHLAKRTGKFDQFGMVIE